MIVTAGPVYYRRKAGGAYVLDRDWWVETGLAGHAAEYRIGGLLLIRLHQYGRLEISRGYIWDGASGPTYDTGSVVRGALAHDALYNLAREGHLDPGLRRAVDKLAYRLWRQDGMWWWRARLWLRAVRRFAASSYRYAPEEVLRAP